MALPNARNELLNHYLLVNCVLIPGSTLVFFIGNLMISYILFTASVPLDPFVTMESLKKKHILQHIVDVSCDVNNPKNPLPIYTEETSFIHPCVRVIHPPASPHLDVTSISHLPSMLPKESSEFFSEHLVGPLKRLQTVGDEWVRADALFQSKVVEANKLH